MARNDVKEFKTTVRDWNVLYDSLETTTCEPCEWAYGTYIERGKMKTNCANPACEACSVYRLKRKMLKVIK